MRIAGNELQTEVLSLWLFYNNICCCQPASCTQLVLPQNIKLVTNPGLYWVSGLRRAPGHYFLSRLCWHSVFAVWLGDCSDKLVLPQTVFHWNHNEQSPRCTLSSLMSLLKLNIWKSPSSLVMIPVVVFLFPVKLRAPRHVRSVSSNWTILSSPAGSQLSPFIRLKYVLTTDPARPFPSFGLASKQIIHSRPTRPTSPAPLDLLAQF